MNSSWSTFCSPSISHERGPVAAVVVALEGVLGRQVALEQAGRGRHARDHSDAAALGELEELRAGRLLEQVVDGLQRGQPVALLKRAHALVAPADLRAQRDRRSGGACPRP